MQYGTGWYQLCVRRSGGRRCDDAHSTSAIRAVPSTRVWRRPVPKRPTARRCMAASIIERGFRDTTVADIVRHARTSKRTFYAQFASKEDCIDRAAAPEQRDPHQQHPQCRRPGGGHGTSRSARPSARTSTTSAGGRRSPPGAGSVRLSGARRGSPAATSARHGTPDRHAGRAAATAEASGARRSRTDLLAAGVDRARWSARADRAVRRGGGAMCSGIVEPAITASTAILGPRLAQHQAPRGLLQPLRGISASDGVNPSRAHERTGVSSISQRVDDVRDRCRARARSGPAGHGCSRPMRSQQHLHVGIPAEQWRTRAVYRTSELGFVGDQQRGYAEARAVAAVRRIAGVSGSRAATRRACARRPRRPDAL